MIHSLPLEELHKSLGAKLVPFGDWNMPVQYQSIITEHNATRSSCGLFDVSHMHQTLIKGKDSLALLQNLTPSSIELLGENRQRYTMLLNEQGGIVDDIMLAKINNESWYMVSNATRQAQVDEYFAKYIEDYSEVNISTVTNVLIAIQGVDAASILAQVLSNIAVKSQWCENLSEKITNMRYLDSIAALDNSEGFSRIARSGYTGEDGYEISLPISFGKLLANELTAHKLSQWVGLGARDTLRTEAGLCLYGHDLNEVISPIQAGLSWVYSKKKRQPDQIFLGKKQLDADLVSCEYQRVGIAPQGRRPCREGADIVTEDQTFIGRVSTGTFSPTLKKPIAMAYIKSSMLDSKALFVVLGGKQVPIEIVELPFVPHRFKR